MAYQKLDYDEFLSRLKSGKYDSAGGARKAIGKSSLSDEEKDKANNLINKKFGEAPVVKKAVTGAKRGPKKGSKRTPKEPVEETQETTSEEVEATPASPPTPSKKAPRTPVTSSEEPLTASLAATSPQARLDLTKQVIEAASFGVRAMSEAHRAGITVDMETVAGAVNTLSAAMENLKLCLPLPQAAPVQVPRAKRQPVPAPQPQAAPAVVAPPAAQQSLFAPKVPVTEPAADPYEGIDHSPKTPEETPETPADAANNAHVRAMFRKAAEDANRELTRPNS